MIPFSYIFFIVSLFLSLDGYLILFGIKRDIEGGPVYIALYFGLPLLLIGLVFAVISVIKNIKNEKDIKEQKPAFVAVSINLVFILLWAVFLIVN